MEEKILTSLRDLGYVGPLLQRGNLKTSIEYGSKNIEYTKLVHFLTNQLRTLSNVDEEVNPISSPEDSAAFVMEISSFLKELSCPYKSLTQGHVSDRLQNIEDRQLLIDYLITELMTARIMQEKTPMKKIELKLQETPEAADMKQIFITLGFPKPPADITLSTIFQKLTPTIKGLIKKVGDDLIGKPFFSGFLSEKQWQMLSDVQNVLNHEYKIRREMLLTRLDVTIQSFQWSDRTKGKDEHFEKIYKDKRKHLTTDPDVDISHLLAARTEVAIIEKTSNSSVRKNTGTSIHKVIIGQVPDRGGRTNELAPPPPEMPSWQQRTPGPPGGGRGGYGRGGGQQNYSRGGAQSNYGRGNYSFGNSAQRPNYSNSTSNYSGLKSSLSRMSSDKTPFSNFDTSLSSYSSSISSFSSKFDSSSGSSNFRSGYSSANSSYSRNSGDNRSSGYSSSNRGNCSSSRGGSSKPFDSSGSYDSPNKRSRPNYDSTNKEYKSGSYSQKRSFDIADNEERGNYGSRTNYGGDNHSKYSAYDSAGSYDTNKRAKSYDNFQTNKSTYSDQYVKDAENNQQYHSRNESARGRSTYHRGRGQGNRR